MNLFDIKDVLEENNILYWVQGKTLLGLYTYHKLLDDHDDDLAIWIGQRDPLLHVFKSSIEKRGFRKIRDTQDIISFERNYRYIDICLFKSINNTRVGYGKKQFPKIYFEKLDFCLSQTLYILQELSSVTLNWPSTFSVWMTNCKNIIHLTWHDNKDTAQWTRNNLHNQPAKNLLNKLGLEYKTPEERY